MLETVSEVLSVRDLTFYLKDLMEQDSVLSNVQVLGEVSNLTYHNSGHVYFSIKDSDAQLSCVMFRSNARQAPTMQAGDEVVLSGATHNRTQVAVDPDHEGLAAVLRQSRTRSPDGGACVARF